MNIRRRFKQTEPLKDRLASFAQEARKRASKLAPGLERDDLIRKATTGRHRVSYGRVDELARFAAAGRIVPMDRLKRSLEQLKSPVCLNCLHEMGWVRSTLVGAEPTQIIHVFTCADCQRVDETTSVIGTDNSSAA